MDTFDDEHGLSFYICLNSCQFDFYRSAAFPLGLPSVIHGDNSKDRDVVLVANTTLQNTVTLMSDLMRAGVAVSIENPHGSVFLGCGTFVKKLLWQ